MLQILIGYSRLSQPWSSKATYLLILVLNLIKPLAVMRERPGFRWVLTPSANGRNPNNNVMCPKMNFNLEFVIRIFLGCHTAYAWLRIWDKTMSQIRDDSVLFGKAGRVAARLNVYFSQQTPEKTHQQNYTRLQQHRKTL